MGRTRAVLISCLIVTFSLALPGASSGQDTRATEQLKSKGFTTCADSTAAMAKFIYGTDSFAFLNVWNVNDPNGHSATTLGHIVYPDVGPTLTSMASAPNVMGSCDGTFTQIMVSETSCPVIRDSTFKEWKYWGELSGTPIYEDPTSPNVVVTLLQVKSVCLIVKSGTLFFPKPK